MVKFMKMNFGPKRTHMARYELVLKLDGALWLKTIFGSLLTQKSAIKIKELQKDHGKIEENFKAARTGFDP